MVEKNIVYQQLQKIRRENVCRINLFRENFAKCAMLYTKISCCYTYARIIRVSTLVRNYHFFSMLFDFGWHCSLSYVTQVRFTFLKCLFVSWFGKAYRVDLFNCLCYKITLLKILSSGSESKLLVVALL